MLDLSTITPATPWECTLTDADAHAMSLRELAALTRTLLGYLAQAEAAGFIAEWSYSPEPGRTVWRMLARETKMQAQVPSEEGT